MVSMHCESYLLMKYIFGFATFLDLKYLYKYLEICHSLIFEPKKYRRESHIYIISTISKTINI